MTRYKVCITTARSHYYLAYDSFLGYEMLTKDINEAALFKEPPTDFKEWIGHVVLFSNNIPVEEEEKNDERNYKHRILAELNAYRDHFQYVVGACRACGEFGHSSYVCGCGEDAGYDINSEGYQLDLPSDVGR